jgi:ABC-2 type transport system permease protein
MSKILTVAKREYNAAVKTKAFIITIVLMPVLMSASGFVQALFNRLEKDKEKKYAVIDLTLGKQVLPDLEMAVAGFNQFAAVDPITKQARISKIVLVDQTPTEPNPDLKQLRLSLGKQVENGDYEALIEIGEKVLDFDALKLAMNLPTKIDPKEPLNLYPDVEKFSDDEVIRFQSKKPTADFGRLGLLEIVKSTIQQLRASKSGKLTKLEAALLQLPVPLKSKALSKVDVATGEIKDGEKQTQIINLLLPAVLIGLMFMVVMVGATPAMQGVVEEKTLRISEVLLGSVTPFQLMAGKLVGLIGVSLTMAVVYLLGGYILAQYMGFGDSLTPGLIGWFLVMLILALMIYGSLFIAVGAAASDIKETQTLLMPIMMLAMIPFFAIGPIIQEPNGAIARYCSFFPFAAPMLLVARESVPPGVPMWEMLVGIGLVLITTFICVWAAGRIFRVGILMQGKGAKLSDLIRWIFKG